MLKPLIILVLVLVFFQTAKAQKQDTLLYYMNNYGEFVNTKTQADYFLFIMPPDSSSGVKLYPINEYYPNGKPKFIGSSRSKYFKSFTFEGPCINYYPSGKKQSIINYSNGYKVGDEILYYPNGKLYASENYTAESKCYLIECRDSLGNVIAKNGEGKWVSYDNDIKFELEEGPVKDSLQEGEWRETYPGFEKFVCVYHKGIIVSSTDPHRPVGDPIFIAVEKMPEFEGGRTMLDNFIAKSIRYPPGAKENNSQGTVIVQCIVEKDGSLSGFKVLGLVHGSGGDKSLDEEALRVVKLLPPWIPARQNGKHVRVYISIPVKFVLNDN